MWFSSWGYARARNALAIPCNANVPAFSFMMCLVHEFSFSFADSEPLPWWCAGIWCGRTAFAVMRRARLDLRLLMPGANQALACARLLGRLWHRKFMLSAKGKQELHLFLAKCSVLTGVGEVQVVLMYVCCVCIRQYHRPCCFHWKSSMDHPRSCQWSQSQIRGTIPPFPLWTDINVAQFQFSVVHFAATLFKAWCQGIYATAEVLVGLFCPQVFVLRLEILACSEICLLFYELVVIVIS